MKFTVKATPALGLPLGKADHIFWEDDIPGFGLRLRAGGSRIWVFQYAVGKKQRRMKLGKFPALGAVDARETAKTLYAKVQLGIDPAAAKDEVRARTGETFEACVKLYLEWRRNDPKKKLRPSTYGEIERHLTRNLKALNGLRIDKVDRRAIALELTRFAGTGGPVQANRTGASVHKFFKWCVGEGFINANPAIDLNKNPEVARDRVLSVAELAQVWRGYRQAITATLCGC